MVVYMNYKKFYKKVLNIEYDSKLYHIHHIDGDRNNNNISNLLLLPKTLHIKLHNFLKKINKFTINDIINIHNICNIDYYTDIMCEYYIFISNDIEIWYNYKRNRLIDNSKFEVVNG